MKYMNERVNKNFLDCLLTIFKIIKITIPTDRDSIKNTRASYCIE